MVLAAVSADKARVELVRVADGARPGERVSVNGTAVPPADAEVAHWTFHQLIC